MMLPPGAWAGLPAMRRINSHEKDKSKEYAVRGEDLADGF